MHAHIRDAKVNRLSDFPAALPEKSLVHRSKNELTSKNSHRLKNSEPKVCSKLQVDDDKNTEQDQ